MSLRAFHVLFITLSVLMVLACGAGALMAYLESGAGFYLLGALGSLLGAAALGSYGIWFIRKTRRLA